MDPKAEEFVLDVRRAARTELKPTVTTDSQLIDPESVTRVLERAMLWLTPKIAAAYDPGAFTAWPEELQDELREAVEGFRAVASTVPNNSVSPLQARAGVQAFARLKEAVRKVTLSEWLDKAGALIDEIESWARQFGWTTRREPKKLYELLLGEYSLDRLYLYAEGNLYILDPVSRFIRGGLGAFDLSIQPSFYVTSIYRHLDEQWYVHLDVGQGVRGATAEPLSKAALQRAVGELGSLL